jgi:DNA polymerase-3 subunit epsilon
VIAPSSQRLAAFDVETTGLSPAYGDRICEVGLVLAQDGEPVETFQSLVNPGRALSPAAARVNGLTDAILRQAPPFAAVAPALLERLAGATLVCHNAPFDLGFLQAELARLGLSYRPPAVIDTLELARLYFAFPSNSLGRVAAALGVENSQAHRALGDALTTLQVLGRMLERLEQTGAGLPAGSPTGPIIASSIGSPGELRAEDFPAHGVVDAAIALPPAIREALEDGLPLEIVYVDARGAETIRRVTPRLVRGANDYLYLVAFCHLRQAERSFRLDRIVALRPAA